MLVEAVADIKSGASSKMVIYVKGEPFANVVLPFVLPVILQRVYTRTHSRTQASTVPPNQSQLCYK